MNEDSGTREDRAGYTLRRVCRCKHDRPYACEGISCVCLSETRGGIVDLRRDGERELYRVVRELLAVVRACQ